MGGLKGQQFREVGALVQEERVPLGVLGISRIFMKFDEETS